MRTHLHAAGIALALAWTCHVLRADDPSPAIGEDGSPSLSVRAILKEAAQIAVRQDKEQGYWRDRVLLKIARIQMRAGDFDRARDSIRSADNQCDADAAVVRLAEELAGAGECERAFQVLREMGTDYDSRPDYSDDRVRMRWLEYLISTRDFGRAGLVVETFAVPRSRPEGLRMLALAYSQTGDKAASQRCLQDAIVACTAIADEFGRAKCLWRIADAQIALSEIKSASSTIEQLAVLADSFADGWARVTALRESAVRMAQIGDREAATRLFRQAIAARVSIKPPAPLPATNRIHALVRIAESQAALGYIDDALETVKLIKRNGGHMTSDSELERALHAVAVAQTKSGDISAALAVVRSFRYPVHYETNILADMVRNQFQHGRLTESLTTAQQIPNPSQKAIAFLSIANEYAKAGDKTSARAVAGQVHLTRENERIFLPFDLGPFDYCRPRTWGIVYQASFTNSSRRAAIQVASEVAAAAMTLSLTLGEEYSESYAIMFKDFNCEVIRALAHTHVVGGDTHKAIAWARSIGSSQKIKSPEDWRDTTSVENRIDALVGVAEGILDKQESDNAK